MRIIWVHSYMGHEKESNEWTDKLIDTDNRRVATWGEGGLGESEEGKGAQLLDDEMRLDFGGEHIKQYTDNTQLYTWNLYNVIN